MRARRTVTAALAGAALTMGLAQAPAAAAQSARVRLEDCGQGDALTRPTTLILTCADYGERAEQLHWTDWSATSATATGIVTWRACSADCVNETHWDSAAMRITLTDPASAAGREPLFTKLQLHVTGPTPPGFMRDLTFDQAPTSMTPLPTRPSLQAPRLEAGPIRTGVSAPSGTLGFAQIEGYWQDAGGPSSVAATAAAITGAESSYEPGIIQQGVDYCGAGSDRAGWGLWQITCGNSAPAYGSDFQVLDPWNNAEAAVAKYDAQGFEAWSTYTSGVYESFMQGAVPPAAGLTDPGEYIQAGATPRGTPSSPAAAPGSTYGPAMPDSSPSNPNPLLELHADGSIWEYEGPPITGWTELDDNPKATAVAQNAGNIYELHNDGTIWQYTGIPITGWTAIGANPAAKSITAGAGHLYELDSTGTIWSHSGAPVAGWTKLAANPAAKSIAADGDNLYELDSTGTIWTYTGIPITGWTRIDDNPAAVGVSAGVGTAYQLHGDGTVWQYTGTPITGWTKIGADAAAVSVRAGNGTVYELDSTGTIRQYTGTPITGWTTVAANPAAVKIAVGYSGTLYELDNTGTIWSYQGTPITGWTKLDDNPAATAISAGADNTGHL